MDWGTLGRHQGRETGWHANLPDLWAGSIGRSGQSAAQEASRSGAAARAKRYADCGLEDKCTKSDGKRSIFRTSGNKTNNRAKRGREKRYAQRHFWTASALEGFGVQPRRSRSMALAQTKPNDVDMKMLIFHWKNVEKLSPVPPDRHQRLGEQVPL